MKHEARMSGEPVQDLRVLMAGVVVEDDMDDLAGRDRASIALRKRMNSWCRWRCMQRPMTLPSSTFNAANSVVVPLRL